MTSAIKKRAYKADTVNVKLLRKKFASISKDTIGTVLRECGNDLSRAETYLKEQGQEQQGAEGRGGLKRTGSRSDNEEVEEGLKKRKTDDPNYFTPPVNLVIEDESMEVIGEQDTQEEETEQQAEYEDSDKRPMRTLTNFCLYDLNNNNRYASIDDIGAEGMDVVAFGDVAAIFVDDSDNENDDDEDDEEGQQKQTTKETANVQLSAIFYWQVHINDDVPELWLLTSYGWYKLMQPSKDYSPLYLPIYARTTIAGMAESELTVNPKLTYKKFVEILEDTTNMLGLTMTSADVEENADYLYQELSIWAEETGFDPAKSSLMKRLQKLSGSAVEYNPNNVMTVRGSVKQRGGKKKTYEVTSEPCVTSHIASVSKDMFVRHLHAIQDAANEVEKNVQNHNQAGRTKKEIYKNKTKNVEWQGESIVEEDGTVYYAQAIVDGEVIKPNDCVYLRTGGEEPWFAQVISMYENQEGNKMFHSRFFSHGKETVLNELAGERELFLLDECSENHLESVMGKCNVQHLDANEREPAIFESKDYWYYRLWYDSQNAVFEDARLHEGQGFECQSCISKGLTNAQKNVIWDDNNNGFRYKNKEYHLHDFVYLLTGPDEEPYDIGKILKINKKEKTVVVQSLERKDTNILIHDNMILNSNSEPFKDNRSLGYLDEENTVSIDELEGTCNVVERSSISDLVAFKKESPNNFFVQELKGDHCTRCKEEKEKKKQEIKSFEENAEKKKLVALDIFGGCGGLTSGMEMTGVIDTRYAIEFNSSAVVSFERNFKHTTVYNKCANLLLRRAISQHSNGEKLESMNDELGRPLQDMPKPGEIDFIYCGPPCQGFSGMNRFKKPDEIKNTLVCTALSYVDFYKPSYFLLENVRGLVSYKLGAEKTPNGVLKYILRCLTSMGYQVRFGIHQAGNHGVAQSRRRLIVWGARIGHQLPDFPEPGTCFSGTTNVTISMNNENTGNKTNICYYNRTGNRAPLPAVSVGDTISDLPAFEYKNTHHMLPDNEKYKKIRQNTIVEQLDATESIVGTEVQAYGKAPKTDFQADIRHGAEKLHNHVTRSFSALNVERVYNIPMRPGADHRDLPDALEPWCLSKKNPASARHDMWKGLYGRLNFEGRFQTQLTEMSPMGKQGTVLHPNQRRVMTVREAARVQGFPDSFIFDSANETSSARIKDMYRQIGNAVPVTLSFALGNKLREALIKEHTKKIQQS
ncbi:hypothetical protein INT45_003943 [Circinella minor]|uniref:Cytosine-specific methyltransferase n=1 Tax=Circinella minor TaxID=1195481 RepID=A0A8H7RXB3_9FUNG|nr:hypothetical protein INT45_003943 [Circinella minor]